MKRIPELDGVRGLAILLVLCYHFIAEITNGTWGQIFSLGWTGVDLFFVLSGFLIGGILLDSKASKRYFQTFYLRRFFRIVLAYSLLILSLVVGVYLVGRPANPVLTDIFNYQVPLWTYPLFVQNIVMTVQHSYGSGLMCATWSLAIEEQFYLLLPFLIWRCSTKTIVKLTAGTIVLSPILRAILQLAGVDGLATYLLLPCRADALGYGLLIALAYRNQAAWSWVTSHRRYIVTLCATLGIGCFMWTFVDLPVMTWIGKSWLALFYASLMILALTPGRLEQRVFRNRVLARLGTVAYGVYLFHSGILRFLHYLFFRAYPSIHNLQTVGVTLLALVLVLALCGAMWTLLEKPLIGHARSAYRYDQVTPPADHHSLEPKVATADLVATGFSPANPD